MTTRETAAKHTALEIEFVDGMLGVTPTGAAQKTSKLKKTPPKSGGQGSLFDGD